MRILLVASVIVALASPALAQRFSAPAGGTEPATQPGAPEGVQPPGNREVKFPTGIYDEKADGATLVREASARARKQNKRVLIMWGENYCGFCAYMMDLLTKEDPRIAALLESEYELVKINIGKDFSSNRELQLYYGSDMLQHGPDGKGPGAPALTVIDPSTDKFVEFLGGNASVAKPMTMTRVFDPEVVLGFLQRNIAPQKAALTALLSAKQKAKREQKQVLLVFVRPGCPECSRLKAWLGTPAAESALAKAFVPAVIDAERMVAGGALTSQWMGGAGVELPWVAAVSADAETPKTKEAAPKGLPALGAGDGSTGAFVAALGAAAGDRLSADDLAALRAAMPPAATP